MAQIAVNVARTRGAFFRMDQELLDRLSPIERQVLAGLIDSRSANEIALANGISLPSSRAAIARITALHGELFGPVASTQQSKKSETAYELPINTVELAGFLKTLLGSETRIVSDAITIAIEDSLSQTLNGWLGDTNVSTDRALLRKLANSVSSLGSHGVDRTREALDSIARWDPLENKLTKDQALQILRDESADYRKAKSYLANQAKCVIAFPKFFLEFEEELNHEERIVLEGKVETAAEFRAWVTTLGQAWGRTGRIKDSKNHKLYLAQWHLFTNTVINEGTKAYSVVLIGEVERTLKGDVHKECFIRSLGRSSTSNRNLVNPRASLKTSLMKEEGDYIAINSQIDASASKLNEMKEDLVFMFSQDPLLKKFSIEVSLGDLVSSSLIVRFIPPKEHTTYRRAIDAINKHIKTSYESN